MKIQHNMPALLAKGKLAESNRSVKKSSEKLSSGYRINRAADDAAGLAISEKIRSQMRGIKQAVRNTQDGAALIQTFEGALGQTVSIIHRMKELAVQSANGEYSDNIDRQTIQIEYLQLCDEVDHIAQTDFNGLVMLSEKPTVDNADLQKIINSQDLAEIVNRRSAESTGAKELLEAAQTTEALTFSARDAGIKCGDLTVIGGTLNTDFKYENNTLTILTDTPITLSGKSTKDHIVVNDLGEGKTAQITLENLDIEMYDKYFTDENHYVGISAFRIADNAKSNVTVTLKGNNRLKSAGEHAALEKNGMGDNIGTLTIDRATAFTQLSSEFSAF